MMRCLLTSSILEVCNMTVTRQDYIYCACLNTFAWTITYNNYSYGTLPAVESNSSLRIGASVALIAPQCSRIQLREVFSSPYKDLLPYDASGSQVAAALEQLSLTADVTSNTSVKSGARPWTQYLPWRL